MNPWRLALLALTVSVLAAAGCDREEGVVRDLGTRAVVIGIDGADWKIIDQLAAEGGMPNFAVLKQRSAWGRIETLKDIARETNPGAEVRVHKLYEMREVVERMQARPRERVLDRRERTQWDKTWVLLLITALLGIEWLIRKRLQMI